ncbi:MAG: serine/threonine protein kinase [Planctomycetes bacterium]|nr:serine/threonine protein kinase [Planctomycetota bacterium]
MMLEDAEILLGKIAIGRAYLSRENALKVVETLSEWGRAGRREPFHSAAVRLGFLERRRAEELLALLGSGELICRGRCGRRVRLAHLHPRDSVACAICGGPLYLAVGPAPVAAADAAPAEPGRRTVLDLAVPDLGDDPAPALASHEDDLPTLAARAGDDGERTEELDAPTRAPTGGAEGGADPLDRTWRSDAPAGEEFAPFAVGDLQVLAPIGRGGMGSVYRARWRGQAVAVKILSASPDHPEVIARFQREVKLAGALDHLNIVRVLATGVLPDEGTERGRPYFVMDHVQGRDLAAWAKERPRALGECVRMVVTLCQAMEHAHSRGVIHRDLKPANVVVRAKDDQPMICDFGLAKVKAELQDLTRTGDILGTPSYMPPEQALGHRQKIGPPTDVYALGALLYHLVTGRPPFLAASAFLTIARVIKEPPEPPRALNPAVPPALEQVLLKALEKDPVARYHTCGELRTALERLGL